MPEETIGTAWLGDAAGNKKYAHSVTSAVYDAESGQTMDKVIHPAYSTNAVKTKEKWINGKDVWRVVIDISSLPNTNFARYPIGYTVDAFCRIFGFAISEPSFIAIPNGHPSAIEEIYLICTNNSGDSLTRNTIGIRTGKDMSEYKGQFIVDFTKTTE
jgi:hypothetical protein